MATLLQGRLNRERDDVAAEEIDRTRPLTAQELEWKQRINERLLSVLDLSLIDTVESDQSRKEIRSISERRVAEESAPLSRKQR